MIDYQTLVAAISDWRAGQRPGSGTYEAAAEEGQPGEPQPMEMVDSGMVMLDDADNVEAVAGDEPVYGEEVTEYEEAGETGEAYAADGEYGQELAVDDAIEDDAPAADEDPHEPETH